MGITHHLNSNVWNTEERGAPERIPPSPLAILFIFELALDLDLISTYTKFNEDGLVSSVIVVILWNFEQYGRGAPERRPPQIPLLHFPFLLVQDTGLKKMFTTFNQIA